MSGPHAFLRMTVLSRAVKIGKPARDRRGNPIISLNQVKEASGKEIATIELGIDELEQRIAPSDFHMTATVTKPTPSL